MLDRKAKNISYNNFLTAPKEDISSHKLKIAQFQRNYVWTPSHVRALISSIQDNEQGFYLGSIVIQRTPQGTSGKDYIVDGQQRLVTMSFIAKALKELLSSQKDKISCDDIIFFSGKTPRIQFSRKTLNKSYVSILLNRELKFLDENQARLLKNYKMIKKEIVKVLEYKDFLDKLKKIEFVVIKCSSTQSVYQLFESLNSKGQKLSSVELTKNALLGELDLNQQKINRINAKWEKIETSFESKGSKIVWFGKFLRHDWFSVGGYISESKLFERIKEKIKEVGAEEYSENLKSSSAFYLSLRRSDIKKTDLSSGMSEVAWKKVEYLIKLIRELQLDQVYAVLLSLIKYGKVHPDYFEKDKFFIDVNKIWSFLILVKYSKVNPSSYETIFANFCFDIHNDTANSFKGIKTVFFKKLKEKIPNKVDFIKKINEQIKCTGELAGQVDFKNNNEIIRLILLTYLSSGREVIGDFSIEHIIPKGSLVNWNNISSENMQNIALRDRYKLGNLTLLKDDRVGNENFNLKCKSAYKKSSFQHNKELIQYEKLFNSPNPGKAVEIRGKEIAAELYKICSFNIN